MALQMATSLDVAIGKLRVQPFKLSPQIESALGSSTTAYPPSDYDSLVNFVVEGDMDRFCAIYVDSALTAGALGPDNGFQPASGDSLDLGNGAEVKGLRSAMVNGPVMTYLEKAGNKVVLRRGRRLEMSDDHSGDLYPDSTCVDAHSRLFNLLSFYLQKPLERTIYDCWLLGQSSTCIPVHLMHVHMDN